MESRGCPHCAGREIVGWGRSDGLLRFRCKSCGRTFNALTRTPMAHLRKKEKWLAHAQAMIEGKSLAKTAKLCGVHPTTAFRWRHRFLRAPADDKPRSLSGIVEADETSPSSKSFKGRWSDLPRKARKRGGTARHPGPYQDNIPVLVARDRKGATFDAVLPQDDNASIAAVLTGVVTPESSRRRCGNPLAAFASRAGIPFHAVPSPESRLPRRRTCTSTTSTPITDASSNGSIASTASPPRTSRLPRSPRLSKAGANALTRQLDRRRDRKWTIPRDNAIRARLYLDKIRNTRYTFSLTESVLALGPTGRSAARGCLTSCATTTGARVKTKGRIFFTPIARNPLKSPDSEKTREEKGTN